MAEKSCYHFAIKPAVAIQKAVISLEVFCPEYHEFFIPTRSCNASLKQFCLTSVTQVLLDILIIHIIIAIQRMIIKILSAVINSIRRGSNTSLGLSCRRSIVLGQQIHTILVHADALPLGVFGQGLVQAFGNSQLELAGIAFQIVWLPDGDTIL